MKKLKLHSVCMFFTLAALTLSCEKQNQKIPIDSDIRVQIQERNGSIELFARTEKLYGCSNYPLIFTYNKVGIELSVDFEYVGIPNGCLTSIGSAKCTVDLDDLEESVYIVKFKLNGETTLGLLSTNPVELRIGEQGNVHLIE